MQPDDPRHGEVAGYHQHIRDGEDACEACNDARRTYQRRRLKLRNMGRQAKYPLGKRGHRRLIAARENGLTYQAIAAELDVSPSVAWRLVNNGPDQLIYLRTLETVYTTRFGQPLTHVGYIRRLQALTWLGYTCNQIAKEAGIHWESAAEALTVNRASTGRVREAVAGLYNRVHMNPPLAPSRATTRARNRAIGNRWAPPMAWSNIDDPTERPERGPRHSPQTSVDDVVVDMRLDGHKTRTLTRAETNEVIRRARLRGLNTDSLGVNAQRSKGAA